MNTRLLLAMFVAWACFATVVNGQQPEPQVSSLSLSDAASLQYYQSLSKPLTYAQQRARFESEQRIYRIEWNNWTGYSPSRPTLNANYMSVLAPRYYVPARGILIHAGMGRSWYW